MLHEKRGVLFFPEDSKDFLFQKHLLFLFQQALSLGIITINNFSTHSVCFSKPQEFQHTQKPVLRSSKKCFLLFISKFPSASFISCLSLYFERSHKHCLYRYLSYCLSVISLFRPQNFMCGCYFIPVISLVAFLLYLLQFSYFL